eukprot:gb/GECH01002850.1/.p1 GENE.gb/GECH01002850.1/~~gb/GECH01002850.1/.p1  ORF type:complete len:386 (+),score=106.50 gb/GECH01002850.1/:1-1158(+)
MPYSRRVFDRLTDPGSYTGVYRERFISGGQINGHADDGRIRDLSQITRPNLNKSPKRSQDRFGFPEDETSSHYYPSEGDDRYYYCDDLENEDIYNSLSSRNSKRRPGSSGSPRPSRGFQRKASSYAAIHSPESYSPGSPIKHQQEEEKSPSNSPSSKKNIWNRLSDPSYYTEAYSNRFTEREKKILNLKDLMHDRIRSDTSSNGAPNHDSSSESISPHHRDNRNADHYRGVKNRGDRSFRMGRGWDAGQHRTGMLEDTPATRDTRALRKMHCRPSSAAYASSYMMQQQDTSPTNSIMDQFSVASGRTPDDLRSERSAGSYRSSIFDRLSDPSTFTGMYRERFVEREPLSHPGSPRRSVTPPPKGRKEKGSPRNQSNSRTKRLDMW